MTGEVFFSEAKKGYNKEEVMSFIRRLNEEHEGALQRKNDEIKRLGNENASLTEEYSARIAELEKALEEKNGECAENAAKYEEICAKLGEKLLFAEKQSEKIISEAEETKRLTAEEAEKKAEARVAAISAKAKEDAAAALRAADVLRQKSQIINASLDQTRRILEDALAQIERAAKNA
ncbi:MAG: hypothetical protein IJC49_02305 [Clostridia bacterium]|nr:hypothetical protein [Clostridia bacterium]